MDENCHEDIPEDDKELEKLDLQTKIFREQNQAPREHGTQGSWGEGGRRSGQTGPRALQACASRLRKFQNLLIWSADQHEHINTALVEQKNYQACLWQDPFEQPHQNKTIYFNIHANKYITIKQIVHH